MCTLFASEYIVFADNELKRNDNNVVMKVNSTYFKVYWWLIIMNLVYEAQ